MKLRDFRIGWRLLIKDPAYSLVAILGLGIGLAVCLLLLAFVRYSWQYDAAVPDADNVYIVKHRDNLALGSPWFDQAPLLLLPVAKSVPGVTNSTGYLTWFPLTVQIDGQLRRLKYLTALPGFAELMGLQAVKGDLNEALSHPDSFAITEQAALRLFGTTDVVGRTLLLRLDATDQTSGSARIAAILPNPPANTTIPFEVLSGPTLSLMPSFMRAEATSGQSFWPSNLLIHVRPGTSLAALTDTLQRTVDRVAALQAIPPEVKDRLGSRKVMDIKLTPLRDAYFDHEVTANFVSIQVDRGDANVVAGLGAIAILILALAAINYVNLATIRVVRRQRELAMRKVLGAAKGRLALQLIAESLLVSMLATVTGLLLAWLVLPVFAELMGRDLQSVLSTPNVGAALGIGLIVGLLTAIYPVWVTLGVQPSLMLAGRPGSESLGSKRLRQALSVAQVAVAMGLASFTAAVALQTRFAMEASPGFNPSALLAIELPVAEDTHGAKVRSFMTELQQQRGIAGIAESIDAVGRAKHAWSTEVKREGHEALTLDVKSVSRNFFEIYHIKPVTGRLFDSSLDRENDPVPIVINSIAARELGFTSPELAIGQTLLFRGSASQSGAAGAAEAAGALVTKRIIGIAPEVRYQSLREAPRAVAYELLNGFILTVRASGTLTEAEHAIRTVWPKYYPNSVVELSTVRDIYAANYADDARLSKLLALSTIIAMIIAAFGTYVLSADVVERRTSEIALRRLFGARRWDIGRLIAGDIAAILLISAIIAVPLAALAIARYLAVYTQQTPIAFWTLGFAVAATVIIAAVAAARHAWAAMLLRPAVALRT